MPQKISIPLSAHGKKLSDYLAEEGYPLSAACGGRGVCGKCRVKIIKGAVRDIKAPENILKPDGEGYILACRALCDSSLKEAEILLNDTDGNGLTHFSSGITVNGREGYGIALDIGTTTLAAALVDMNSGRVISSVSRLNPQRSYGADVISRISACADGRLQELNRIILQAAARIIEQFALQEPDIHPQHMTVSGNTTMLHLFCGVSPEKMGSYPFTPEFTQTKIIPGKQLMLPVQTVTLLPSASAFIGSDITGGAAVTGMLQAERPSVLIDIGTNGEMVFNAGERGGGRIYTASAAAGPALEGAKISCGMGGVDGALCRASFSSQTRKISYRTINDKPIRGICGCGLVDVVSIMLETGVIDETGYMEEEEYFIEGVHISENGKILAQTGRETKISITQQDIREFQLAKSAIAAGLEALASHASLKMEEISQVFIAGGLGYYIDTANAKKTGLLPRELCCPIKSVGNASLLGAIACLCDQQWLEKTSRFALQCENFELNKSAVFNQAFIERMLFIEEE